LAPNLENKSIINGLFEEGINVIHKIDQEELKYGVRKTLKQEMNKHE
jgi:hypothetical protein